MSFLDIAGIVKGASEGEGLGNKFLANIREADAIAQVVRGFSDPDVVHVAGKVDAASDMETINTELILADLQTLEKAEQRYEKEVKGRKLEPVVLETAREAIAYLNDGKPLSTSSIDLEPIRELGLLTAKPFIYVFNVDEDVLTDDSRRAALAALVAPAQAVFLDAKLESELIDLDAADAAELLASTGQTESGLDQLARIGFDTLGLQTYLTAGPKESRAWTIHPHRLREGLHQGRSHLLRRPRRRGQRRRGPFARQSADGREGVCDAGRGCGGVPVQRVADLGFSARFERCCGWLIARSPSESEITVIVANRSTLSVHSHQRNIRHPSDLPADLASLGCELRGTAYLNAGESDTEDV